MYKIDLHTHSTASADGGLRAHDYREALKNGLLDVIAVTDHNTTAFACKLQQELGNSIIVGEEISTKEGEIIGLYLQETVQSDLSVEQTIRAIHDQHGLVYVPHPFETIRKGITIDTLNRVAASVDIIEIHNGRAIFQNRGPAARAWSAHASIAGAASSDAHGRQGWGKTYSLLSEIPSALSLCDLLKDARYELGVVGLRGLLYPKFNKLRRRLRHA